MTTYADYQAQIAALQEQAEAARRNEVAGAKAKIKEILDTYGLTINDLSGTGKSKSGAPRAAVPAKYRDPATGSEWTGRGRAPLWLAGKDKEQFLIK